jgi:hypothetical protein
MTSEDDHIWRAYDAYVSHAFEEYICDQLDHEYAFDDENGGRCRCGKVRYGFGGVLLK